MFKWLAKPYPLPQTNGRSFLINGAISVFVAFFLIVFQPFGLSESALPEKNFFLAGYGLVCFIATSFCSALFSLFQFNPAVEKKWNTGLEILWILFVIIIIALSNFFYTVFLGLSEFGFPSFGTYVLYTFAIGIFPVVLTIALKWQKMSVRTEKESREINDLIKDKSLSSVAETKPAQSGSVILLRSENENEKLELNKSDLLFIESMDNYSRVHYRKNNINHKLLLRGSLKFMEGQLTAFPQVLRCHRTFIVNLDNVESAAGNAQGYKLQLKNCPDTIPVSRNYLSKVLAQFKSVSKTA